MSKIVVAIDGPAGSGKSSVSKAVARELGYGYLDTGAAYRALTWASKKLDGFSVESLETKDLPIYFDYSISTDPKNYWVRVGSTDVTAEIRSQDVAEGVSAIASIQAVRNFMKQLTRALVDECPNPGIIVEGRDITTVVLPDATVRLLLTATEEVRLKRRSAEIGDLQASEVAKQVTARDASDSKVVDFMTPAAGVALVDSSELNFEQTVAAVVAAITSAAAKD